MSKASRPIAKIKFRSERAERDWRVLVKVVQDAAKEPGYAGPPVALVERVHADVLAVLATLDPWHAALAETSRGRGRPTKAEARRLPNSGPRRTSWL